MDESNAPPPRRKYKNSPTEPRELISAAAPVSLVRELDAYCESNGTDRSKAVRAAVRLLLASPTTH